MIREKPGSNHVVEVPLLFEKSLENWFDFTVCVACDPSSQLARLEQRGMDRALAVQRISKQLPLARKIELSDFVLWNDGSTGFLKAQVERIVASLDRAKTGRPSNRSLMPLPPKTEDDVSAPGDDGAKPARRGRPRTRKPDGDGDAPAAEAPAAVFVPEPAPEPAAPAPAAPAAPQEAAPAAGSWDSREPGAETVGGDGRPGRPRRMAGPQFLEAQQAQARAPRRPLAAGTRRGPPRIIPPQPPPPAPAPVYGDLPDPARFADVAALDALAEEISSGKGEPHLPGPPLLAQPGRPDGVRART